MGSASRRWALNLVIHAYGDELRDEVAHSLPTIVKLHKELTARGLAVVAVKLSKYIPVPAMSMVRSPGAGWITFDPTNRGVGGSNLIPVAVARGIAQAMPVTGSFVGMTDAFQGMTVDVDVTARQLAARSA